MSANLIARWLFENNLNDSSGNGLNLTGNNNPTYSSTDKKEGSYALNLVRASNQGGYINDVNLPSNFPLKNGTTNLSYSISCWVKNNSTSTNSYHVFGKNTGTNTFCMYNYNGWMNIWLCRPGAGFTQTIGRWYFIAASYDKTTGQQITYVWDDTAQSVIIDSIIGGTPWVVNGNIFSIGIDENKANGWDGLIDAFSIYDGPLNREELVALKSSFTPIGAHLAVSSIAAQIEYTPPAANNFTNDASCIAWYKLNTGALTADSKGTNTLTNVNTVGENSTYYKIGTVSGQFDNASKRFLKVADAGKAANFPFKSDTKRQVTMLGWVRQTSSSGWRAIFGSTKYATAARQGVNLKVSGTTLYAGYGLTGVNGADWNTGKSLTLNQWYHIALTADGNAGFLKVRLWDDVAGTVTNYSTTLGLTTLPIPVGSDDFRIGAYPDQDANYTFDGEIDEVIIFNRCLTDIEIDAIRLNQCAGITVTEPAVIVDQVISQVEYEEDPRIIVSQVIAQVEYETQANIPSIANTIPDAYNRWRFDIGNFLVDSMGNANLQTSSTGQSWQETDFGGEGKSCVGFSGQSPQRLYITDANLPAGYPLKVGDTTKAFTISFMMFPKGTPAASMITKWAGTGHQSLAICTTSNRVRVVWCNTDGTTNNYDVLNYVANAWNRVFITVDGVNKLIVSYNWIPSQNAWCSSSWENFGVVTTPAKELQICDADFSIGSNADNTGLWQGWLDDIILWKRKLGGWEIAQIIGNNYPEKSISYVFGPELKARYNFESPDITVDNTGNGNTLVSGGAIQVGTPYVKSDNTGVLTTGYGGNKAFSIADANLCAGFPLKNGDAVKKITITSWFIFSYHAPNITGTGAIFSKMYNDLATTGLAVYANTYGSATRSATFSIIWGDGTNRTVYTPSWPQFEFTKWLFFALSVDGVNRTIYSQVYDLTNATKYEYSIRPDNQLAVNNNAFCIGRNELNTGADCYFDDVIVMSNNLTPAQIDMIRMGTYNYTANPMRIHPLVHTKKSVVRRAFSYFV